MKKICAIVLAAVLMVFTVVPAFAAISPMPPVEYDVIIENTEGGKGSYTTEILEDKKHAILVAHPKDGYKFSHWVIEGDYTITDGSLTSDEITVLLNSDIVATPHFVADGKKPGTTPDQDHGSTSPQTGDFIPTLMIIFSSAFAVLFAGVGVKLATSKK